MNQFENILIFTFKHSTLKTEKNEIRRNCNW